MRGLFIALMMAACSQPLAETEAPAEQAPPKPKIEGYLDTPFPPADGFDFPVGTVDAKGDYKDLQTGAIHRGWYVATEMGEAYALGIHTGEDWNGRGGGNTDLGQPVYAMGAGRVVSAGFWPSPWGGVVLVEHIFYENHQKKRVQSQYAHLSRVDVKEGDVIGRRQQVGLIGRDPNETFPAHLHFEIRTDTTLHPIFWPSTHGKSLAWVKDHYAPPTEFIEARRELFVPQHEETLVIVEHDRYRMQIFTKGKLEASYEVAFGQAKGAKEVRGDNKTPKGMYFVVSKYRGKFDGPYGRYYGGHWIKINYPNAFDAERGLRAGLIDARMAESMSKAWRKRKLTAQKTELGSGIGFHGWEGPWSLISGGHLSWGCMVMHNPDIKKAFDTIAEGAMVVIR